MKNNKGFTLVELLTVIIVLSIIAVITAPVISGVLNSAKEEMANDSAYGYKRAVDKYFYHKNMNDETTELNGVYQVSNSGALYNSNENHVIEMDGEPPKDGVLLYQNSELASGCLTINKYKVTFENGLITNTEKGSCDINETLTMSQCLASNPNPSPSEWFKYDSSNSQITGFTNTKDTNVTEVAIPCSINGVKITSIADSAFKNQNITSIVIPNTITTINANAFADNKLVNVTIPDSVTVIGNKAFENNLIETITLSNNLTEIGASVFQNNKLTNIEIPNKVSTIANYAFAENKLENLIIPSSVRSLGFAAFYKNELINVEIPNSVISVSSAAFNNNYLPDNQAYIYARDINGAEDATTLVSYGGENKNITLPNTITTIESSALWNNGLQSVTIPNSVVTINSSAFSNNLISEMSIPESVTYIGANAFYANHISTLTIPNSVTTIERAAFNSNYLKDEQAYIYARNADGTENTTTLVSYGGENKNITLPSNITVLGEYSLGFNKLESVILNEGLTTINKYAFYENNLTSLTIPSTVTTLASNSINKSDKHNPSLTTIYNNTNTAFDWNSIILGSNPSKIENFITGTVASSYGDITITTSN